MTPKNVAQMVNCADCCEGVDVESTASSRNVTNMKKTLSCNVSAVGICRKGSHVDKKTTQERMTDSLHSSCLTAVLMC